MSSVFVESYTTLYNLNVLNLKHKNLATEDDINNRLTMWADMFLARTWNELYQAGKDNDAAKEVVQIMQQINTDQATKTYLEAHERYLHSLASQYVSGKIEGREEQRLEDEKIIAEKDHRIAELESTIKDMKNKT